MSDRTLPVTTRVGDDSRRPALNAQQKALLTAASTLEVGILRVLAPIAPAISGNGNKPGVLQCEIAERLLDRGARLRSTVGMTTRDRVNITE